MYEYRAKCVRVVDGDTVDALIDLGFGISVKHRLRLAGIDAPEVRGSEKTEGEIAKRRLSDLIVGAELTIITTKQEKYGRYLADVWLGKVHINDLLVREELARRTI